MTWVDVWLAVKISVAIFVFAFLITIVAAVKAWRDKAFGEE